MLPAPIIAQEEKVMKTRFLIAFVLLLGASNLLLAQSPVTTLPDITVLQGPAYVASLAPEAPPMPVPWTAMPAEACVCDGPGGACICDGSGCPICPETCGPPGRLWLRGEYLLWWLQGQRLPPLLTTSPAGTPQAQAGVLGAPGTSVLFGGDRVDTDARSGGRVTAGYWFDEEQTLGIEANFFYLEQQTDGFSTASAGVPILARPFFAVDKGRPDSLLVAFPGLVSGLASATASSSLFGGEVYLRQNLCCGCCYRVDLLAGYRFLRLTDNLDLREEEINAGPNQGFPLGTAFDLVDRFTTENEFHGGEVGFAGEVRQGKFFLDFLAKVALGGTIEELETIGGTNISQPGAPTGHVPVGFLVQQANSGHFSNTRFAVVPEIGINAGYQLTDHLRAMVGYTFLYWSEVARAGDQIDLSVNTTQLPPGHLVGPARPAVTFQGTDFWAQGISFGLELRY
jgi:hypothetical protein